MDTFHSVSPNITNILWNFISSNLGSFARQSSSFVYTSHPIALLNLHLREIQASSSYLITCRVTWYPISCVGPT